MEVREIGVVQNFCSVPDLVIDWNDGIPGTGINIYDGGKLGTAF